MTENSGREIPGVDMNVKEEYNIVTVEFSVVIGIGASKRNNRLNTDKG